MGISRISTPKLFNAPRHGERFDALLAHRRYLVFERIVSSADIQPVDYAQAHSLQKNARFYGKT